MYLLINKKNELITWSWEDDQKEICLKYFNIENDIQTLLIVITPSKI